jgi:hypothetical protein
VSEFEGRVSRRSLLRNAGAAAVAAMAAGTLLNPREAAASHYDSPIREDYVVTHLVRAFGLAEDKHALYGEITSDADDGAVWGRNFSTGPGVKGTSDSTGVKGVASGSGVESIANGSNGTGVKGTGRYGVWGESNQAGFYGVFGRNTNADGRGVRGVGAAKGVLGESTNGTGVEGKGKVGVLGTTNTASRGAVEGSNESTSGYGVWGNSKGIGVQGTSSAPNLGAVEGHNSGGGAGVAGVGKVGLLAFSHTDGWIGAWGRHTANGFGVAGDSAQGIGVSGESTSGIGGQFKGGKAQLRLVPGDSAGAPTDTHSKGELYMDSRAALWVCVRGGNPATWEKVTTS